MMDSDQPEEERKRVIPEPVPEEGQTGISDFDDPALKEAAQLSSGKSIDELEELARRKEHARGEAFRDHFENLAIAAMYVLFGTLCVFGIVWALHMILPERCVSIIGCKSYCIGRWLTGDQITILQDIVTGGLIAGLLADHFRKRVGR
jgi:hypothetical protein